MSYEDCTVKVVLQHFVLSYSYIFHNRIQADYRKYRAVHRLSNQYNRFRWSLMPEFCSRFVTPEVLARNFLSRLFQHKQGFGKVADSILVVVSRLLACILLCPLVLYKYREKKRENENNNKTNGNLARGTGHCSSEQQQSSLQFKKARKNNRPGANGGSPGAHHQQT